MSAKKYDALVVGAGMGGLAAAALWANKGFKVCVLESHYSSGGCAGFYKRREGFYDVGATTLSGLKDGRPVKKVIDELQLEIETHKSDPGIVVHLEGKTVNLYSGAKKLAQELYQKFGIECHSVLTEWLQIEDALWSVLDVPKNFPKIQFSDISALFKKENRLIFRHPKLFTSNFYNFLPSKMRNNSEFVKLIDQLLLISTQQTSKTCPAFMGILGFLYPMDTHSISGGMHSLTKALENSILENGGELFFRSRCESIIRVVGGFEVKTKKESYTSENLICNVAPSVFKDLINDVKFEQDKGEIWGANSAYFYIQAKSPVTNLYHQVHDKEGSLFFSISTPEIKSSIQRVTVSGHVDVNDYDQRDINYEEKKRKFKQRVLLAFESHFKEWNIEKITFDSVGTPLTFQHYTGRPHGEVGGLVHESISSLFRLMPSRPTNEKIFFVGDYSFPGQGIVSVFQSAINTLKNIS